MLRKLIIPAAITVAAALAAVPTPAAARSYFSVSIGAPYPAYYPVYPAYPAYPIYGGPVYYPAYYGYWGPGPGWRGHGRWDHRYYGRHGDWGRHGGWHH
jgi:hypothetical protein